MISIYFKNSFLKKFRPIPFKFRIQFFLSIITLFFLSNINTYSQQNDKYLAEYINIGLKENLSLQSAKSNLDVYDAKVSQAIANFLPKVDATSRYTRAGGGRSFEFPLGSMMNPLYEALGLSTRFVDITESFIRPEEQDTKVELIQPVFNLAVLYGYKAQDNLYQSANYEYKAKQSELVYSLKESYYNYAKALQLVAVRKSALALAKENHLVITKMYQVDKVPKTDVLRAEVLLSTNQQDLQNAINQLNLARNFFNSLLNRDFESEIKYDTININELKNPEYSNSMKPKISLEQATETSMISRPELKQLEYGVASAGNLKSVMKSEYFPNIAFVADYGIQDVKYNFSKDARYWTLSGIVSWNLFSGFGTNAKVNEAEAQLNSLQKTMEHTRQLIRLEVKNNYLDLQNNLEQFSIAEKSYSAAAENYSMTLKRYEEGLSPFISLIDAKTSLDATAANYVVTYCSALTSKAKLEKSIGLSE
jgi:outer membrane protein